MFNKLKKLFNNKAKEESKAIEPEEADNVKELPKEVAGLSIEAWSGMEVNLGTLDNIEKELETYEDTVGVVKATVDDEVIIVESVNDIEEGGIKETVLSVVKEEVENTPGISQEEVEISVIEVGTTEAAVEVSQTLGEVLTKKYDL